MRLLVTAGSTAVPIDRVRVISNVFGGRTGRVIAEAAARRGASVTLLTSGREVTSVSGLTVRRFRTYDDLARLMEAEVADGDYDVVIHSAAVSDYRVAGIVAGDQALPSGADAVKISSSHQRLCLELVPTEKLIDKIRAPWGFGGTLVKFKLQVGLTDAELIEIAERSRRDSSADLIVANCLEWMRERAYLVGPDGARSVSRAALAEELLNEII